MAPAGAGVGRSSRLSSFCVTCCPGGGAPHGTDYLLIRVVEVSPLAGGLAAVIKRGIAATVRSDMPAPGFGVVPWLPRAAGGGQDRHRGQHPQRRRGGS